MDKGQYQNPGLQTASLVYTRTFCGEREKRSENWGLGTVPEICPGNSEGRGGGGLAG